MNDHIAGMKGLGFWGVGLSVMAYGLIYSPWFSFEVALSRFATVSSLLAGLVLLIASAPSVMRGDRLHGTLFAFWAALSLGGPGMIETVWANPGAYEGIQGSRVWNGWILFAFALLNLPLGIAAWRDKEVRTSGAVAIVLIGVMFTINAIEHWGTAYWGSNTLFDPAIAGTALIAAGAAFYASARSLFPDSSHSPV